MKTENLIEKIAMLQKRMDEEGDLVSGYVTESYYHCCQKLARQARGKLIRHCPDTADGFILETAKELYPVSMTRENGVIRFRLPPLTSSRSAAGDEFGKNVGFQIQVLCIENGIFPAPGRTVEFVSHAKETKKLADYDNMPIREILNALVLNCISDDRAGAYTLIQRAVPDTEDFCEILVYREESNGEECEPA